MQEYLEYRDLCMTCNYAETCFQRKTHGKPVWYCEQFDDYIPQEPKATYTIDTTNTSSAASRKVDKHKLNGLKGLCCNCENLETCTYPKPEEGIWNCEDYR
jgi:hypothetical protein